MRIRPSAVLPVALFLLAGLAFACKSVPPSHLYVVTTPDAALPVGDSSGEGVHLGVSPFQVDSPYDGDQLVYRIGRDSPEVGYYAQHRWAAPLRDQLPLMVAAAFTDLPGIASISPIGVGRDYDAELVGRLLYLEELDLPGEQTARVGLELALVDREENRLWSQTVSSEVGGQADEVGQIVRSMRQALEEALRQARPGLAEAAAGLSE